MRTRSKPVPDPGSPMSELSRYMIVVCLVCGAPTYRVAQRITPDLASEEGPVLPTEDWVEKELCKSSSGWIEVYHGCLVSISLWGRLFCSIYLWHWAPYCGITRPRPPRYPFLHPVTLLTCLCA